MIKFFLKIFYKLERQFGIKNVSQNVFHSEFNKNVLVSYIRSPFIFGVENRHQNNLQVLEIAKIFYELGYNVDVVDYDDTNVNLTKKYNIVFDILAVNKPIYIDNIEPSTKKIIYFTGSESEFANNAELRRIDAIKQRRGVDLEPRRQAKEIIPKVELYDASILIGNEFNLQTYLNKFNLQNIHLVPNTGYDYDAKISFANRCPNKFLFLGGTGCVHKGLDLLLEIFSEDSFPCELYICGYFSEEKDFSLEYNNELYHTTNIHAIGFIDVLEKSFIELCNQCSFTILPSCSEGQAGSITTCMSAGLIPICSKECGFDDDEVINLRDCSIETIRSMIIYCSQKDLLWVEENGRKEIELAKTKYSIDNFRVKMREAIESVL